jgi:hypothetical protein
VAAITVAQLGGKVTLIEKEELGGTCLNQGCVPTKVLLRGAELMESLKKGADFGIRSGTVTLDFAKLLDSLVFARTGFLLLRKINERFGVVEVIGDALAETRSHFHTKHSIFQTIRQQFYQMPVGSEDSNNAGVLSTGPTKRRHGGPSITVVSG